MDFAEFQEKPIQLIYVSEDGKYLIHPDAEQFLSKIPKPLSIISVAGLYRTGKSYLLNRILLNRNSGFGVGPTINPCTKGLWCWGTPLKGTMQNGEKTNIIIVDSQGIGALDQDQNHDLKIFTLSILTSSTFIYNSVGSIDENALQNLSLVINLTNNIQLNTQQDEDPQDLGKYFPSFVWVVRDFSLQLISSEGQAITPKDYLERALAPQKGFSDDVEEKNRIRRMLTSFFKERQCATLVRPLVNQQKLQQLHECQFQQLRPQFVEQALSLRKKILSSAKPKLFKGQQLDGSMYISMLKSYVTAINNGGVPNIENAWTYMCIEKCIKLQEQCYKFFAEEAQSCLQSNFPCSNEIFQEQIQRIQAQSLRKFESQQIGEQSKEYSAQLQRKFKDKVALLRMQNQKQAINFLKGFIIKNFTVIQKKMRMNEFQNFQDFLKTINNFYFGLLQNGPDLPKKQIVYLDFLKKVVSQGAQVFLKQANQSLQSLRTISQQRERLLLHQSQQLKQKIKTELERSKQRQDKSTLQRLQLENKCKYLEISLQDLNKHHKAEISRVQLSSQKKLKVLQIKYDQICIALEDSKQKNRVLESSLMVQRKERQKQKALLELKISQMKDEKKHLLAKDRMQQNQINDLTSQFGLKMKQTTLQSEKTINELNARLKAELQKNSELNDAVQSLSKRLVNSQQVHNKTVRKHQQEIKAQMDKYQNLKLELDSQKSVKIQYLQEQNTMLKDQYQELKHRYVSIQKISKESTDRLKTQTSDFQTKLAIECQKNEFLKFQLDQLKQKTLKDRNYYECMVKNIRQSQEEEFQKLIVDQRLTIQEHYKQIIRNLQNQIILKNDISEQKIRCNNINQGKIKQQFQIQMNKLRSEVKTKIQIIQALQQQQQKVQKEHQLLLRSIETQNNSKEEALLYKIKQIEEQLQCLIQKSTFEQQENNNRSEESLKQIKNYYELEKQKLQHKIALEKDKYQKRLFKFKEEYENQIQEQRKAFQEQMQNLKDEFHNQSTLLKELVDSLQHENDSKVKTLQLYQKRISEEKEKLQRKELEYTNRLENFMKTNASEKQILQNKMSEVVENKNKVEKEIIVLQHQKEQLTKELKQKTTKYEAKVEEVFYLNKSIEKIQIQNRQKLTQTNNINMNQKLNYQRKIALLQQEKQFYTKKITQNEQQNSKNTHFWQQKLQKVKNDWLQQLKQLQSKKLIQYENLQVKYEKLRTSTKENQQQMVLALRNAQSQLIIQRENFAALSQKCKEFQEKKQLDSEQLGNEIGQTKEALFKLSRQSAEQIENLRKTINEVESQRAQISLLYQKDKILLQNKLNFLEESKQKNKKQYVQKIKNLEQTLQNMQKARVNDKSYYQRMANQSLTRTQKKYQAILQENLENFSKKQQQYEQVLKKSQSQMKNNLQRLSNEIQGKQQKIKALQKKVKELQQSEKKSQNELQRYKINKQSMNSDNLHMLQKQKQNLKLKIFEKEQKYKKIQGVKQQLFLDIQRQKAKWNLQKDNYIMKVDELKDTIAKYQRDNEKLHRQNDKLKDLRKNSKLSSINGLSKYSFQRANSKYLLQESVSSINLSVSKENANPLGEISFFNNS